MSSLREKEVQELRYSISLFAEHEGLSIQEAIRHILEEEYLPLSCFVTELSPLETVVKFLKENHGKSLGEIAALLHKKNSSIWLAYHNAVKKRKTPLPKTPSKYDIPLQALNTEKVSLLEAISLHLHDSEHLTFKAIGKFLHRNERTIWTSHSRARKKLLKAAKKREHR